MVVIYFLITKNFMLFCIGSIEEVLYNLWWNRNNFIAINYKYSVDFWFWVSVSFYWFWFILTLFYFYLLKSPNFIQLIFYRDFALYNFLFYIILFHFSKLFLVVPLRSFFLSYLSWKTLRTFSHTQYIIFVYKLICNLFQVIKTFNLSLFHTNVLFCMILQYDLF